MAYTANKKPSGLNAATIPLAGANEVVLSQAGTVVRATLNQVESKVFDAKTQVTPVNGDVVVVRRGSDIRQMVVENMIPNGAIANAQISGSAAITDGKLAQITSANKVANSATTATNANTANAIVARDGSGNFSAGTITASLSGTATSASALTPGATIAMTGDVSYTSPTFTGASNVTAAATINPNAVTTAKINDLAVTEEKIANNNVTNTKIRDSVALSVIGRPSNSPGNVGDIQAGTDGHVLRRSGITLGFGQIATTGIADSAVTTAKIADSTSTTTGVTTAKIADSAVTTAKIADSTSTTTGVTTAKIADASSTTTGVTNAKIRHSAGLSVIGRSGDTTGSPADITAGTDGHVLRRSGTSVGFGQVATSGITNRAVTAIKLDGNQSGAAPVYAARVWVRFNGTTGATVDGEFRCTIVNSGNVSKVVRVSEGIFDIYFETSLDDANFAVFVNRTIKQGVSYGFAGPEDVGNTSSKCRIQTLNASAQYINPGIVNVMVFR